MNANAREGIVARAAEQVVFESTGGVYRERGVLAAEDVLKDDKRNDDDSEGG